MCMCCVRRRVVLIDVLSLLLPALKKKKKNCTCYASHVVVTTGVVTYGIRAGSTRDLGSLRLPLIRYLIIKCC
jgi:energy-converting hydrogenase Eha subunit A